MTERSCPYCHQPMTKRKMNGEDIYVCDKPFCVDAHRAIHGDKVIGWLDEE